MRMLPCHDKKILLLFLSLFIFPCIAQAHNKIEIASFFAKTGIAARSNKTTAQGIVHAVEKINKAGGILGKQILLREFDTRSTPIGAAIAAKKALKYPIVAAFGAPWSSQTLAIAPIFQKKKIPLLATVATHPSIPLIGEYIFQVCFNDEVQAQAIATVAHSVLQANNAVILADLRSDYSMTLATAFKKVFLKKGASTIIEMTYQQKQKIFLPLLKQVAAENPDILFIPSHDEISIISKQINKVALKMPILGGDGWTSIQLPTLNEGYYTTHWRFDENDTTQQFYKNYSSLTHVDQSFVLAYDTVMLVANALHRAQSIDPTQLQIQLQNTHDFMGQAGVIAFDEQGRAKRDVVIVKIQKGQYSFFKRVIHTLLEEK